MFLLASGTAHMTAITGIQFMSQRYGRSSSTPQALRFKSLSLPVSERLVCPIAYISYKKPNLSR